LKKNKKLTGIIERSVRLPRILRTKIVSRIDHLLWVRRARPRVAYLRRTRPDSKFKVNIGASMECNKEYPQKDVPSIMVVSTITRGVESASQDCNWAIEVGVAWAAVPPPVASAWWR
jgi:hypothetical protein